MVEINTSQKCLTKDFFDEYLQGTEYPPSISSNYELMKNNFLLNISHELRTPINVIIGSVQLFEMMGDDVYIKSNHTKVRTYQSFIKQNCYRLLRLVNNLIDSAEFDSNHVNLSISNYNIVKTVSDITSQAISFVENKSITLEFKSTEQEIITAFDEDKIRRVILNLLSNAIKFTSPGGSINISVMKHENKVYISVKDTGCGIPEESLNHIFERFSKVEESLNQDHEGSGIGLFLSSSIIQLHSGNIHVTSEQGKGSNFVVELPLRTIVENDKTVGIGRELTLPLTEMVKIELSDI